MTIQAPWFALTLGVAAWLVSFWLTGKVVEWALRPVKRWINKRIERKLGEHRN